MINNDRVFFDDLTHSYLTNDGNLLIGVTSLMRKHGLAPDYSNIPEDVLMKAAEKGSKVHKDIELYCKGEIVEQTAELKAFKSLNLPVKANEYLISDNEMVASSIDIVLDDYSLVDIKTTSSLHIEPLSWQLSIYAYLFELQNQTLKDNKLYALWLPKPQYGRPKLVEVQRKPSEWVIDLIDADKNGLQYNSPATQTQAIALSNDVVHQVIMIEQQLKEMQETRKELQQGLLELMKLHNIKSFKADGLSLSYKGESIRTGIDTKKLKDLYPDIYEECLTQSIVKESIIIKTT